MKRPLISTVGTILILCMNIAPMAQATSQVTVKSSKSGTQKIFQPQVGLTPLKTDNPIKVNDLLHYTFGDFIDMKTGKAKGNLDTKANALPKQLPETNWYVAPSLTNILQKIYYKQYYSEEEGATEEVTYEEDMIGDDMEVEMDVVEPESVDAVPVAAPVPKYSKTNVQVEGVDEADIIKTDGRYIYYMHSEKGIAIFDTMGQQSKQIAMLKPNAKIGEALPSYEDLYISGQNLIIVSQKSNVNIYQGAQSNQSDLPLSMYSRNNRDYMAIDIYNVSDPYNPKLTRQINVEGSSLTTRLYNNNIYFLLNQTISGNQEYNNIVDIMPKYQDSALGEEYYIFSPNDIHLNIFDEQYRINLTTIVSIDLDKQDKPIKLTSYENFGVNPDVYMNKSNLYLAFPLVKMNAERFKVITGMIDCFETTKTEFNEVLITRFNITKDGYSFAKLCKLPGYIKDKFALDEYDSTLRVISSTRYSKYNTNDLYLLDTATLTLISKLNISSAGNIDAVRYRGNTAYISTSNDKSMIIIDLSNNKKPKKMGSIEISGFSGYLHPYKENYLIGFGKDVENTYVKKDRKDKHIGYRESGVLFTMYDISNPKKPKLIDSLVIGGPHSNTVGISNPKAIMFDLQKGSMTMPFTYKDAEIINDEKIIDTWNGGLVVEFSPSGFKEGARFELGKYFNNSNNSRFIYIGDQLYYVTGEHLVSMDYNTYKIKQGIKISY